MIPIAAILQIALIVFILIGCSNALLKGIKRRKFQRCPFNVGKPFFRWGYVILSQNKSDLVVF